MAVESDEFKQTLRRFASGVTIVTVSDGRTPHGMTASSFSSVSLDPPRILVSLKKESHTRALVVERRSFGVSILSAGRQDVARSFARRGVKPFESLGYRAGIEGVPVLDDAIGWLECTIYTIVDGGDHDVVIGDVMACGAAAGDPLIYYDGDYTELRSR